MTELWLNPALTGTDVVPEAGTGPSADADADAAAPAAGAEDVEGGPNTNAPGAGEGADAGADAGAGCAWFVNHACDSTWPGICIAANPVAAEVGYEYELLSCPCAPRLTGGAPLASMSCIMCRMKWSPEKKSLVGRPPLCAL